MEVPHLRQPGPPHPPLTFRLPPREQRPLRRPRLRPAPQFRLRRSDRVHNLHAPTLPWREWPHEAGQAMPEP